MVKTIWSDAAIQAPAGSFVVKVIVTLPKLMSEPLGVYVGLMVVLLKVPVPDLLHVAEFAPPPKLPVKPYVWLAQIEASAPALTSGASPTTTPTVAVFWQVVVVLVPVTV